MGELADVFREMKKRSQEKRAENRHAAPLKLESAGIEFQVRNMGAHLIVQGKYQVFDFWPGTGKFIGRSSQIKGRGIRNLLAHCEVKV